MSDLRKKNLPKDIVEEDQLQPCWEVGIDSIFSKVFVMLEVVPLNRRQTGLHGRRMQLTLKAEQYGMPMGKLANIANALLGFMPLNARLCVIS